MRSLFGYKPPISPVLKRANQLMLVGSYRDAAQSFEELLERSGPQPGPQFAFICLQAGSARLQLGQPELAVSHFRRGLDILVSHGRYIQMYHAGQRIKTELEKRGLAREARVFMAQVHANMPAAAEVPTQHVNEQVPSLPSSCPVCGGPIRIFELHWVSASLAECSFCASSLDAL